MTSRTAPSSGLIVFVSQAYAAQAHHRTLRTSTPRSRPPHVGSAAMNPVTCVIAKTKIRSKKSSSGVTRSSPASVFRACTVTAQNLSSSRDETWSCDSCRRVGGRAQRHPVDAARARDGPGSARGDEGGGLDPAAARDAHAAARPRRGARAPGALVRLGARAREGTCPGDCPRGQWPDWPSRRSTSASSGGDFPAYAHFRSRRRWRITWHTAPSSAPCLRAARAPRARARA